LVGVYLGDGCVTTHQGRLVFRLNTIDEDFAEATKDALAKHSDRRIAIHRHAVSKSTKDNFSLRCGDPELAARLRAETDNKRVLPEWIWTADHDGRLAFIAGLMDSEGFVSQSARGSTYMGFKSTDPWFDDFVRVLNRTGIEVGKIGVEQPRKPGYRTPRRFHIRLRSWVDAGAYFNIARKQARVERWAAAQLTSEANMRNAA
jgi:intein/homing endonuclease